LTSLDSKELEAEFLNLTYWGKANGKRPAPVRILEKKKKKSKQFK
jgi:hypothetical protein